MRYFLFLIFMLSFAAPAFAQFNIMPQRIIIGPTERSGEFTIFNMSNEAAIVAISIRHSEPLPSGGYNYIEEPLNPLFNPEDYIRFTPRQFEIPANGRQKIRLSVRKPANLPPGSYHFHVRSARYEVFEPRQVTEGVGVGMNINVAFNAPVIVHHGRLDHGVRIDNVEIRDADSFGTDKDVLGVRLVPTGNAVSLSVGKVIWEPADGSDPYQIGIAGNVIVFPSLSHRDLNIALQTNIPDEPGQLRLVFYDDYNPGAIFDEVILNP